MKEYRLFNGTGNEYVNLHNQIRKKLGKPKKCLLCKAKNERFELANLSQEYSDKIEDWAYLCGHCHKRYDSYKYKWDNGWFKLCTLCKEIKPESSFYKRRTPFVSRGHKYNRKCTTAWCKECTKIWSAERKKALKTNQ